MNEHVEHRTSLVYDTASFLRDGDAEDGGKILDWSYYVMTAMSYWGFTGSDVDFTRV